MRDLISGGSLRNCEVAAFAVVLLMSVLFILYAEIALTFFFATVKTC